MTSPAPYRGADRRNRRVADRRGGATPARWRRAVTVLGKTVFALVVFAGVMAGGLYAQLLRERASPLPDPGGRQGECALWFIGSSSMHKWTTLQADMLPWIAHNRGVDGAGVRYVVGRFESEAPGVSAPSAMIFYAGENDIANGRTNAEILAQVRRFVEAKRARYGETPLFIVSVKPSPTRWRFRTQQRDYNAALSALARSTRDVHYIDIVPLMLVGGRPGPFYQADGIHLDHAGYRRWGGAVRSALEAGLPATVVHRCTGAAGAGNPTGRNGGSNGANAGASARRG